MFKNLIKTAIAMTVMAAMQLSGAPKAQSADMPHKQIIPLNTMLAIGVSDTRDFWRKSAPLPLVQALTQYLNGPELAADLDYQAIQLEIKKFEQQLGYPLTMEQMMGHVFSSFVLYALPAASGEIPPMVIILDAADPAKAAKLVEALDQQSRTYADNNATQPAAPADPTSPAMTAAPAATFKFERTTLDGIPVSHYSGALGLFNEGYYALTKDNRLIFATRPEVFTAAAKGQPGVQNITQNPNYAKLMGALPVADADMIGWMDADFMVQASNIGMIMGMMPFLTKSNKAAFALAAQNDGFLIKSTTTADRREKSANIQPGTLPGMALLPVNPLTATIDGGFDSAQLSQEITAMRALPMLMGGGAGGQDPITSFEQSTGISIQQDLAPALGNEIIFGFNSFSFDPSQSTGLVALPQFDVILAAKVGNRQKFAGVMQKVEAYIQQRISGGGAGGASGVPAVTFQDVPIGSLTGRTINAGFLTPSYVITGSYVIIGLSPKSLISALGRANGAAPSLAASPLLVELGNLSGNTGKYYSYNQVDVSQTIATIQNFLPMLLLNQPPARQAQMLALINGVLARTGQMAALETRENNLPMTYVKLKMK